MKTNLKTIDEYIALYPSATQVILQKIRKIIKKLAPLATEAISYGIPTFKLNGNLIHFAGYKNHIGFYPGAHAIEVFGPQLSKYKLSKGTVQFQLDEPIPYDIITKIVEFRLEQSSLVKTTKF